MHADLTRWTFDPARGYRSVLMQQGRVLLDAEWNEQASIEAHHDEVRTADVVGRVGGPAPLDGGTGPFAIVDAGGNPPTGAPWADLTVTAGRYYVDGVLVESSSSSPLGDQPFLEPAEPGNGRYAVYLDVFDRLVTADERPELLESALGGPDTAGRTQTVWQVRLAPAQADEVCSQLAGAGERTPRSMKVRLQDPLAADDPCSITSGGGYTRLENQLYRVELTQVGTQPRFVWSRENGSVVAGLDKLEDSPVTGTLGQLTVDRVGRDDELSIGQDAWVEVTSPQRQVRGLPGWFAQVSDLFGTELHVTWLAGHPASLTEVGETPVVRRWEGAPRGVLTSYAVLEGGIEVAFPAGGDAAVGDYWLIPARTSRLAYGIAATHGTIEWPWSPSGNVTLPPVGPVHHIAPLAVLDHDAAGWTLIGDCRHLFPPLTELITIDLVGGDGQEALPGAELPEPVRVVVRDGGLPVAGAAVFFTTPAGGWLHADGTPDDPTVTGPSCEVHTDADGVAAVRWRLFEGTGAPTTQTLTAHRLNDVGQEIDVDVIVTGRLSVASEVFWQSPDTCSGFVDVGTVQGALDTLVTTRTLRLLGGDGQEVEVEGRTVPELVRVIVDTPCGPAVRARVRASTSKNGAVQVVDDGSPVPPTIPVVAEAATGLADEHGVVAFAWQPSFAATQDSTPTSDVLTIELLPENGDQSDRAGLSVVAQLDPPGGRTAGIHVRELRFFSQTELLNDEVYGLEELGTQFSGIAVGLDAPVEQSSVQGRPVVRLLLELPWPTGPEGEIFGVPAWARRTIEIAGEINADGALIIWRPVRRLDAVLKQVTATLRRLAAEQRLGEPPLPLLLRFQIDGWAITGAAREGLDDLHVNGHTVMVSDGGKTRQRLPSTDEVTGGRFETWFWFTDEAPTTPGRIEFPGRLVIPGPLDLTRFDPAVVNVLRPLVRPPVRVPIPVPVPLPTPPRPGPVAGPAVEPLVATDLAGRTLGFVERRAVDAGVTLDVVEEDAPGTRRNTVLGTEELVGGVLRVRVARGIGG